MWYRIANISCCSLALFLLSTRIADAQIAAAGWCVVQSSDQSESEPLDPIDQPDDSFPPQADESNSALGCDIGIGFSLYTYRNRLAVVAVVGSESVGSGVAWILNPHAKSSSDHRPVMAIAVGVVTPYNKGGIGRNVQLALGMTLSLRQKGE